MSRIERSLSSCKETIFLLDFFKSGDSRGVSAEANTVGIANAKNCLQEDISNNGEEKEIDRNVKEEKISRNEVKTTVVNGDDVAIGGNIEQCENEKVVRDDNALGAVVHSFEVEDTAEIEPFGAIGGCETFPINETIDILN